MTSISGYTGPYGNFDKNKNFKDGDAAARYGANVSANLSIFQQKTEKYLTFQKQFKELLKAGETRDIYLNGELAAFLNANKDIEIPALSDIQYVPEGANDKTVLQQSGLAYANEEMKKFKSFDGNNISYADAGYSFLGITSDGSANTAAYNIMEKLKKVQYKDDPSYADVDGSGKIDGNDFNAILKKIDLNGNGIISNDEAAKIGRYYDIDGQEGISKAEYLADVAATDGVNTNPDGKVTSTEMDAIDCYRAAEIVDSKSYKYDNWTQQLASKAYKDLGLADAEKNFKKPETASNAQTASGTFEGLTGPYNSQTLEGKSANTGIEVSNYIKEKGSLPADFQIQYANKDSETGKLSIDSILAYSKASLEHLDTDKKDGIITKDEYLKAINDPATKEIMGKYYDTISQIDGKEGLTFAEHASLSMFQDMTMEAPDGIITDEEASKAVDQIIGLPQDSLVQLQSLYTNSIEKKAQDFKMPETDSQKPDSQKTPTEQTSKESPKNEYVLKQGDTLWAIAKANQDKYPGMTTMQAVEAIAKENNITPDQYRRLRIGMKITISGTKS